MKISYAIPVCNEHVELEKLLSFLTSHIDENDEIVVQCDQGNTTHEVHRVLGDFKAPEGLKDPLKVITFPLNGHFSNFKNNLKEHCTGDWIFQIDADELPHESLIQNNHKIKWQNKVHEQIIGISTQGVLPTEEMWSIYHHKGIKRQEIQNNFYNTL